MLPGLEMLACPAMAVPMAVMQPLVAVESSGNPHAIGVVGGSLQRQPESLAEAVATARMLDRLGRNFSVGLAQVNRRNLAAQGLDSWEKAFDPCLNLQAGARILAQCRQRAGGDWGKALSCYYSGNFHTGFRQGYVRKVFAAAGTAAMPSTGRAGPPMEPPALPPVPLRRQGDAPADRLPGAADAAFVF